MLLELMGPMVLVLSDMVGRTGSNAPLPSQWFVRRLFVGFRKHDNIQNKCIEKSWEFW